MNVKHLNMMTEVLDNCVYVRIIRGARQLRNDSIYDGRASVLHGGGFRELLRSGKLKRDDKVMNISIETDALGSYLLVELYPF